LFSGLSYQIGVLLASGAAVSQAILAETYGYATTLACIAAIVMLSATIIIALGRERMGRDLHASAG
jgi:MFS superfamily sulfate permease-like transporter